MNGFKKPEKNILFGFIFILIWFLSIVIVTAAPQRCFAVEPWGIYVERIKDTEGLERCKICGKILGIGSIHMDAEAIVVNHLKNTLKEMEIDFIDNKGTDRYIHVLIYRFMERRGGNLAVERPASVGFHIHLIEKNNNLKKVYVFDETQQALSQNVFKLRSFLKRRARWLTASELAEEGIYEALQTLKEDLR